MTPTLDADVTSKAAHIAQAATHIAALIDNHEIISRATLNAAMTRAFGVNDSSGAWSQRDSFEMLEQALVLSLLKRDPLPDPAQELAALEKIALALPTQTVRSEDQVNFQQFSTPAPLAWLAGQAARLQASDIFLEPSAGTGLLAVAASRAGATLLLNELSPLRFELLSQNFAPSSVSHFDASLIDTLIARRPSVIVMNPPFAKSGGGHDDRFAAVKHFRSALRALQPNGRLVAIMPDNFSGAGMNTAFSDSVKDAYLIASWRIAEGAFAKHGTSVAVRVIIVDKCAQREVAQHLSVTTLEQLLPALAALPERRAVLPTNHIQLRAAPAKAGLFAGFKSAPAKPMAKPAPRAPIQILPVSYRALETPAPIGDQVGIYLPYRPSRMTFECAGEHPTQLVESVAMGSIAMPIPRYIPQLPAHIVSDRVLSAAQLETIVYAGDATDQYLPGTYITPEKGLELIPHEQGKRYRCFLSLTDKARGELGEFFNDPHKTSVVWGGHRVLFIFMHHSERYGLYYDIQTSVPVGGAASGSSFPTCTLVLKNKVFIPIPEAIAGSFIPGPNYKRKFEIRFDIIRSDLSD